MTHLTEPEIDLSEAEVNELLALVDRVSRSPQLRRASRLRELLLYIGKQSIEKGRTDLHEQEIGCSVFGRPSSYDTSQDNIVRVNATELRKRLESYFATDGASEAWVLEIPRGGYSPVFSRRVESAPVAPREWPATDHLWLPFNSSGSDLELIQRIRDISSQPLGGAGHFL